MNFAQAKKVVSAVLGSHAWVKRGPKWEQAVQCKVYVGQKLIGEGRTYKAAVEAAFKAAREHIGVVLPNVEPKPLPEVETSGGGNPG
jgi:hypothetical protein